MVSQQLVNIIIKAEDKASQVANKVDESINKIGKSSSKLSKIPGFDALRTKLSGVATSIDAKFNGVFTKLKNGFNSVKNKVTGVASSIKSKMSSSLDKVKAKLQELSSGTKGLGSAMNFLKSAASMAVGIIGYDLLTSLVQVTRASLNARSSIQAFAGRLHMSSSEVSAFQQNLDQLQSVYKKIDMDVAGQQAVDLAYRLGLPKTSLAELTETTAIFTDAMQRNGRSAEDSMLAMSDAMDGQFVRLKELGISQQDLIDNGWSGDIEDKTSLLHAMNKALKEQNYDELAKSVDTLDDAWQVLSITLGNLLEAVLLPLTPIIVGIVSAFTDVVNVVKGVIQALQGAFGALPPWMQDLAWAAALVVAIVAIASVIDTALVAAFADAALAALEFAAAMMANPWTWVVAALVAIAYAIYEVGKAFGWWSDVQGMLGAIWAGLNRLWSAFINHPDVQAAIQFISDALGKLWAAVQKAGQAVLEFFGISAGSNWDIVRAIIDGIGWAWNGLKSILEPIINVVMQVWNAFNDLMASLGPVGDMLVLLFVPGGLIIEMFRLLTDVINGNTERWGWLGTVLGVVIGILKWVYNGIVWLIGGLTQLWNTFSQSSEVQGTLSWLVDSWNWLTEAVNGTIQAVFDFLGSITGTNLGEATNLLEGLQLIWENLQEPIRMVGQFITDLGTAIWNVITGQQDLLSAATDVWNSLLTNIAPLVQAIVQIVINFAYQLALWAYQAGMNFVLNIINYIRTLPSQVMNWLNQTGTNVNTGMQRWIATAISKASSMVSNILSYIRTLPSRILALLLQVLASIRSAGSQWVSAARSKASELVNSAASTIAQLPGRVRSALAGLVEAVVAPFRNAYNSAKYWADRISSIVIKDPKSKGGYDLPASQEIDYFGNWGADYYTTSENTVTVKGGADLNINLTGLPAGVDEETVAEIVLQSIQSDSTIERLVSNPLFQSLDAKMKGKTQRRVNRSRGV